MTHVIARVIEKFLPTDKLQLAVLVFQDIL